MMKTITSGAAGQIGRLTRVNTLNRIWQVAVAACLLAVVYWSVIASDLYVSEARVVVERSDGVGASAADFTSLLVGNTAPQDLLLLREYLLSADMLKKLDAKLGLRKHYADSGRDPLSRLWFEDASLERFHDYYLKRVSVEYDDFARVLVIRVQGYTSEMAHAIAQELVADGERFMNEMTHRIASEQVVYIEKQVHDQGERLKAARQALVAYQNANGLVSPRGEVESLSTVVANAEATLAELHIKRNSLKDVFTPQSPAIQQIDAQIAAVERQMAEQRGRMVSTKGRGLNRVVEEHDRLQAAAEFAFDIYKTAIGALEKARIEATRKLKNVAVVQSPTRPEYPLQPRRIYNIVVFVLMTLMLAGVVQLLSAIIRDHRD
ncbi:capsule polysialic acid export protein [Cupriavidus taiwanensis]|uniref:chain-length determining protein n=1 Tax=Cupriavidus taiwanensis TaxID=164546 RepID=UPI000E16738F|nr:chain-length determining protein [Cupriavidus taiwanensis]SOY97720.1 capsule polysialic acid export protein [Cupriavidus taiwanensis]SOZ00381.1 capsule polysialic acid export protein [Cupriavidus taiwanensis]